MGTLNTELNKGRAKSENFPIPSVLDFCEKIIETFENKKMLSPGLLFKSGY